jgi:hypothetical protein
MKIIVQMYYVCQSIIYFYQYFFKETVISIMSNITKIHRQIQVKLIIMQ